MIKNVMPRINPRLTLALAGMLVLGAISAHVVESGWWWSVVMAVPFMAAYIVLRQIFVRLSLKADLADEISTELNDLKETQSRLIQSAKVATAGTFAAGVAHEINNPLTIITGRSNLFIARLKKSGGQVDTEKAIADMEDISSMASRISSDVIRDSDTCIPDIGDC